MFPYETVAGVIRRECLRMCYEEMLQHMYPFRKVHIQPVNFLIAVNNLFHPILRYEESPS